jgi:hypothetical protein
MGAGGVHELTDRIGESMAIPQGFRVVGLSPDVADAPRAETGLADPHAVVA